MKLPLQSCIMPSRSSRRPAREHEMRYSVRVSRFQCGCIDYALAALDLGAFLHCMCRKALIFRIGLIHRMLKKHYDSLKLDIALVSFRPFYTNLVIIISVYRSVFSLAAFLYCRIF